MFYSDVKERRKRVAEFIKMNPHTTHREIKKKLHTKIEKVYQRGMDDAFKDAGIKPPRNFKIKTNEEKRKIVINYIKKNPGVGGHKIRKDTKINFSLLFKNIEEAYKEAGIVYPRRSNNKLKKRGNLKVKKEIIKLVRNDPLISISEIASKVKTQPYHIFKNIEGIYRESGIKLIKRSEKRRIKKQKEILKFIKNNSSATQRDINLKCKTHVQDIFDDGIFEAYEKAGIKFPYERLQLYGTALKNIKQRAKNFEEEIAVKLSGYGKVSRLVKTRRGVADIIFERKDKKIVVEVKDYRNKEISISQIKQLNKYLEDISCNLGLLICHNKPKKDRFLIDKREIFILTKDELNKIPLLI